jgi:CheY-like chemotaxis protein
MRGLVCNILKHQLGAERILQAIHGVEALKLLKSHKVDIILCDYNMPQMDGAELLKRVRADKRLKNTPFLMMTAESDRQKILTAAKLGVSEYLVKPFNGNQLEERLRAAWNLEEKRQGTRYYCLPKNRAAIIINNKPVDAELINISYSGAYFRLSNLESSLNMMDSYRVQLQVKGSADKGTFSIQALTFVPLHVTTEKRVFIDPKTGQESLDADFERNTPPNRLQCVVGGCFIREGMSDTDKATFDQLIPFLEELRIAAERAGDKAA